MSQLSKNEFAIIPSDDPWKYDVLGRKAVADYLTPVVASIRQPFVVSLHSPYGTGKSYFLQAWQKDLEGQGYCTAMFNAWETDFTQDPLSAFMVSIKRQLMEDEAGAIAARFEKLKKGAASFFRKQAAPMLAQAALRRLVGDDMAKDLKENFAITEDNLASLASALASEALESQEQAEKSMEAFKSGLEEVVQSLVVDKEDADKQKVVIFVDELDRCRPTYAIEILECIKHFFSVPGLVFVLAVDDNQLQGVIQSVYGLKCDAQGYLRRFFEWRFVLPRPSSFEYSRILLDQFDLSNQFDEGRPREAIGTFQTVFGAFSTVLGLTLRDQERAMSEIALALKFDRNWRTPIILALGVLAPMRVKRSNSLDSLLGDFQEVETLLSELDSGLNQAFEEFTQTSWEYYKPRIHRVFLSERGRNTLSADLSETQERVSTFAEAGDKTKEYDELKARQDYLTEVLNRYGRDDDYLYGDDSWAKWAYRELTGASRYLSK